MKCIYLLALFALFMPCGLFGLNIDSLNSQYKKFNLNISNVIGNEIASSRRIEFENSNWGKIIFNVEFGTYNSKFLGGLMFDTGLGYGFPMLFSKKRELSINGIVLYMQIGVFELKYVGPSAMIETEYKKTWNRFPIPVHCLKKPAYLFLIMF